MNNVLPMDAERSGKFQPIPDLKVGEKLEYKGGANYKSPRLGMAVIVYALFTPEPKPGNGKIVREDFFAVIQDEDGDIMEFSMDSRYFERVSE